MLCASIGGAFGGGGREGACKAGGINMFHDWSPRPTVGAAVAGAPAVSGAFVAGAGGARAEPGACAAGSSGSAAEPGVCFAGTGGSAAGPGVCVVGTGGIPLAKQATTSSAFCIATACASAEAHRVFIFNAFSNKSCRRASRAPNCPPWPPRGRRLQTSGASWMWAPGSVVFSQ